MKSRRVSLAEDYLEFEDPDSDGKKCKVSFQPMSTRDALTVGSQLKDMQDEADIMLKVELVELIFRACIVNIEAEGLKFRAQNMGEYIDMFQPREVGQILVKCLSLMNINREEKKTSD